MSAKQFGKHLLRCLGAARSLSTQGSAVVSYPDQDSSLRRAMAATAPVVVAPIAMLLSMLLASCAVEGQTGLFSPLRDVQALRSLPDPAVRGVQGLTTVRSRWAHVDLAQLQDARTQAPTAARAATATQLTLNLFADEVFVALLERSTATASESAYVLSGRLEGVEWGTWKLLVRDDAVVGTVETETATYNIRTVDGVQAISKVQRSVSPNRDLVLPRPGRVRESSPETRGDAIPPAADRDMPVVVDVAVVYTSAAIAGAPRLYGDLGIYGLIGTMRDNAMEAYKNSGAKLRISIVGTEHLECVAASSLCSNGTELLKYLAREGQTIRDKYQADLISWIVAVPHFVGAAYHGGSESVMHYTEEHNLVFAHELGHNMYLQHDRWSVVHGAGGSLNDPHPYSHGYVSGTCRWHTIMAYRDRCDKWASVRVLKYFSNPNVTRDGEPMGVRGQWSSHGIQGPADAVRTLNEKRWDIADRR